MKIEIKYSKKALRVLKSIPADERQRIQAGISNYAENPTMRAHHVEKLQGRKGYRIRIGKWRVIFDLDGNILAVFKIGPRGSIYKV